MKWLFALLILAGCDRVFGLFEIVDASPNDVGPEGNACGSRFQTRRDYDVGTNPQGVALADVNNDDRVDILVANSGSDDISILLNDGQGRFTAGTPLAMEATARPRGIIAFNLNSDSFPDIAILNSGLGKLTVIPGRGDGMFGMRVDYMFAGPNPVAVAAATIDSDGSVDLVVLLDNGSAQTMINVATTYTYGGLTTTGGFTTDVALADVTGDGKNDLLIAVLSANSVFVFPGNGLGSFSVGTQVTVAAPRAIALGLVDTGSTLDIAVANDVGNTATVLLGGGNGTFSIGQTIQIGTQTWDVALGTLGNGSSMDLAVAQYSQTPSFFVSDGDGTGGFAMPDSYDVPSASQGLAIGDLDGRAPQDVVVANYDANSISVLLGCQ